jgi:hypothetical protein
MELGVWGREWKPSSSYKAKNISIHYYRALREGGDEIRKIQYRLDDRLVDIVPNKTPKKQIKPSSPSGWLKSRTHISQKHEGKGHTSYKESQSTLSVPLPLNLDLPFENKPLASFIPLPPNTPAVLRISFPSSLLFPVDAR